jgi:hypothetical protein
VSTAVSGNFDGADLSAKSFYLYWGSTIVETVSGKAKGILLGKLKGVPTPFLFVVREGGASGQGGL